MEKDKNIWVVGGGLIPNAPPPQPEPSSYLSWLDPASQASVVNSTLNFFDAFSDGISLLKSFRKVSVSTNARKVQDHLIKTNLTYLGIAMASDLAEDMLVKLIMLLPIDEEESKDYVSKLSTAFLVVNSLILVRHLVKSSIDYMTIASAAHKQTSHHLDKYTCECPIDPSISKLLQDPISNLIQASIIALAIPKIPHVGAPLAVLYGSLFYGSSLIQNRLSMCLSHRREYIQQHNFSAFGFGLAFMLSTELAYRTLSHYSGRNGFLMYDAIFTLIFEEFIHHAITHEMNFLPDDFSIDPSFLIQQYIAPVAVGFLSPLLKPLFTPSKRSFSFNKLVMILLKSYPVKKLTDIHLDSLDESLKNETNRLFIEMIHTTLMIVINEIEKIPDNTGLHIGKRLQKWGQFVGIKNEKLELARQIWEIQKKGIFSTAFLEPIRQSLNKAAGYVPQAVLTAEEDEFFDAQLIPLPPPVSTGSKPHVSMESHNREAEVVVRRKNNQTININHDYESGSSSTRAPIVRVAPGATVKHPSSKPNSLGEPTVIPYSTDKAKKLTISPTI